MAISMSRQEELDLRLDDNIAKLLSYDFTRGHIDREEMEWMVSKLSTFLNPMTKLLFKSEKSNMAHSGVIIQRYDGKKFDEAFLNIVFKEKSEYLGYAYTSDGAIDHGVVELSNLAEVKEQLSSNEETNFVVFPAKGADTEESHQPFVTLTDDKDKAICVTFMNGDFHGAATADVAHSAAWVKHQHYLIPKIIDMNVLLGEDIEKLVEYFNKANTKSEIANECFPGALASGEILILFNNGKSVNIIKGDKHKKYDWGEISEPLSYTAKDTNTLSMPAKKGGLGGGKTSNGKGSVPDTGKKPETAKEKKSVTEYMIVPRTMDHQSIQALNSYYDKFGEPEDKPSAEELEKMKGQAHLAIEVRLKAQIANNAEAVKKLVDDKKIVVVSIKEGGVVKQVSKPDTKTEITVPVLIIPEKQRENFNKVLERINKAKNDMTSGLVFTPELILANKKLIQATNQLGSSGLDQFEGWYEAWSIFDPGMSEATKAVLIQYMLERVEHKKMLAEALDLKKAM